MGSRPRGRQACRTGASRTSVSAASRPGCQKLDQAFRRQGRAGLSHSGYRSAAFLRIWRLPSAVRRGHPWSLVLTSNPLSIYWAGVVAGGVQIVTRVRALAVLSGAGGANGQEQIPRCRGGGRTSFDGGTPCGSAGGSVQGQSSRTVEVDPPVRAHSPELGACWSNRLRLDDGRAWLGLTGSTVRPLGHLCRCRSILGRTASLQSNALICPSQSSINQADWICSIENRAAQAFPQVWASSGMAPPGAFQAFAGGPPSVRLPCSRWCRQHRIAQDGGELPEAA